MVAPVAGPVLVFAFVPPFLRAVYVGTLWDRFGGVRRRVLLDESAGELGDLLCVTLGRRFAASVAAGVPPVAAPVGRVLLASYIAPLRVASFEASRNVPDADDGLRDAPDGTSPLKGCLDLTSQAALCPSLLVDACAGPA